MFLPFRELLEKTVKNSNYREHYGKYEYKYWEGVEARS